MLIGLHVCQIALAPFGAHEANLKKLAEKIPTEGMPSSYKRLLELGTQYESQITWLSWFESHPTEVDARSGISVEARLEHAWRWVGAYLWAHGFRMEPDAAQSYVQSPQNPVILWSDVDERISTI